MYRTLRFRWATLLFLAGLLVGPSALLGQGESAFEQVVRSYEAARLALINDTLEGVPTHGRDLAAMLDRLAADYTAAKAGVDAAQADEVRKLLPLLREAATSLAKATELDAARDAFYELSKPLVRWRKAAIVEVPAVAYCPMAKRSWLQPDGELGNPYYGQSMLTCGETIES